MDKCDPIEIIKIAEYTNNTDLKDYAMYVLINSESDSHASRWFLKTNYSKYNKYALYDGAANNLGP